MMDSFFFFPHEAESEGYFLRMRGDVRDQKFNKRR